MHIALSIQSRILLATLSIGDSFKFHFFLLFFFNLFCLRFIFKFSTLKSTNNKLTPKYNYFIHIETSKRLTRNKKQLQNEDMLWENDTQKVSRVKFTFSLWYKNSPSHVNAFVVYFVVGAVRRWRLKKKKNRKQQPKYAKTWRKHNTTH